MKKTVFTFLFCTAGTVALAAPATQVSVSRPTTSVKVQRPVTRAPVVRPVTSTTRVERPVTNVSVSRPVTAGSATEQALNAGFGPKDEDGQPLAAPKTSSAPAASKAAASAPSYTPSYKKAKDLKAPKAASLGKGEQGLGMTDPNAAQKAADAKAFKVEKAMDEKSAQNVKLPDGFSSKLKQRSHEAAKIRGKK